LEYDSGAPIVVQPGGAGAVEVRAGLCSVLVGEGEPPRPAPNPATGSPATVVCRRFQAPAQALWSAFAVAALRRLLIPGSVRMLSPKPTRSSGGLS
jgi:hypothetical protein